MTGFEFAVTYIVCWWMVLFMVLPHQADAPKTPEVGHAPSAPENPQLGKKMRWATVLAVIPAVAMYFIVSAAHAEDTIYHAGSACKPLNIHTPDASVAARDGYATGDKKVKPATLEGGSTILGDKDTFSIPLQIPSTNYVDASKHNVDLSHSFINAGELTVSKDGETKLNGNSIVPQETYGQGCDPAKANHSLETTKD